MENSRHRSFQAGQTLDSVMGSVMVGGFGNRGIAPALGPHHLQGIEDRRGSTEREGHTQAPCCL